MNDRYRYYYRVVRGECSLRSLAHLGVICLRTRCVSCHCRVVLAITSLHQNARQHADHTLRHRGARYRRHARRVAVEWQSAITPAPRYGTFETQTRVHGLCSGAALKYARAPLHLTWMFHVLRNQHVGNPMSFSIDADAPCTSYPACMSFSLDAL